MEAQTDCEDTQQEKNIFHIHCENCIKLSHCNVKPTVNVSCEVVSCSLNCGFRFHACKRSEHRLLCANEKEACINAGNGCPVFLVRSQRAQHLETCPASVIMCNMEWNRWPVNARHQHLVQDRFYWTNFYNKCQGQLDVALAFRDQSTINKWPTPPVEEDISCSDAVPVQPADECKEESDIHADGASFRNSICGDPLEESEATNVETLPESGAIVSESVNNCTDLNGSLAEINMNDDPSFELNKNIEVSDTVELSSDVCVCRVNRSVENVSKAYCEETLAQFSDNTDSCNNFCCSLEPLTSTVIPPSPSSLLFLSLDVDLTLQSFNRYQDKPGNMYTFLCTKEFRRDEYTWHYKNVHSDIHGGLNGWLEHRCPLAQYGCNYSIRRFYPSQKGFCVIYSDIMGSFGVKPSLLGYSVLKETVLGCDSIVKGDGCSMSLSHDESHYPEDDMDLNGMSEEVLEFCQLPFEVLRHLCRFLDAFSLCNLALTCRLLRDVCCSFLEERGIVVQEWKRQIVDSKTKWIIAYKRWMFSTAFSPVTSWGFEERENMSNHLQSCNFFNRNVIQEPYFHLFGLKPSVILHARLTGCDQEVEEKESSLH